MGRRRSSKRWGRLSARAYPGIGVFLLCAVVWTDVAVATEGTAAAGNVLLAGAFLAGAVGLIWASLPARGRLDAEGGEVRGSVPLAALYAGFIVLWTAATVLLGTAWWDDPSSLGFDTGSRGSLPVLMALSLVMVVPLLVRLLAGRAHHWRVSWGGEELVVRGWWGEHRVAWRDVRSIDPGHDSAVLVVTRRGGKDVKISMPVYDVPAAELFDRLRARVVRHPGGAR